MSLVDEIVDKIKERELYVDFVSSGECPRENINSLLERIVILKFQIDRMRSINTKEWLIKKYRFNEEFQSKINGK